MPIKTADLCDRYQAEVHVAEPVFKDYGGAPAFGGQLATVKVYEDNILVRRTLEEPGAGRVLVVDGGGSLRCALVGDIIASIAQENGWAGVVVFGAIRDASEIGQLSIGVKALGTNPLRSKKEGQGQSEVPVTFAGVTFTPGHYLYADADGIVLAARALE